MLQSVEQICLIDASCLVQRISCVCNTPVAGDAAATVFICIYLAVFSKRLNN